MIYKFLLTLLLLMFVLDRSHANISVTDEIDVNSYNFVSTNSVNISAKKGTVWKHLVNLKSWMYDFELSYYSGPRGEVGEVLRLYPEQDFFVQVTSKVPGDTLVFANLPSTFNGEYSTGVAVISLSSYQGKTSVNLVMSRRYTWIGEGENTMKAKRLTQKFIDQTNATWSRFLERLRSLSESA